MRVDLRSSIGRKHLLSLVEHVCATLRGDKAGQELLLGLLLVLIVASIPR